MIWESLIESFNKHIIKEHGVVDLHAVVSDLENQGIDPVEALEELLRNPEASNWWFYCVEGMRMLAAQNRLSRDQGATLLKWTATLAQQRGMEEYFKSITALAMTEKAAGVLVDFVSQQLEEKSIRDWRWLVFFASSALVQRKTASIPSPVVAKLEDEVSAESDALRRKQLEEIVSRIAQLT